VREECLKHLTQFVRENFCFDCSEEPKDSAIENSRNNLGDLVYNKKRITPKVKDSLIDEENYDSEEEEDYSSEDEERYSSEEEEIKEPAQRSKRKYNRNGKRIGNRLGKRYKKKQNFIIQESLPPLDDHHSSLIHQIQISALKEISPSKKIIRGANKEVTGRRSQFIGVSQNGDNWQVMVNLPNFKKYAGTYFTERQAALVNDFFTISIDGSKACTNFHYTAEHIEMMVDTYHEQDRIFKPKEFLAKVGYSFSFD